MRTTDRTVPGDDLLTLVVQRAGLPTLPAEIDARIDADLMLLNAADRIRRELDAWEAALVGELDRLGMTAKRCARCGDWFAAAETGRKAIYCSRRCQNQRS